jgi:hypothetical protein
MELERKPLAYLYAEDTLNLINITNGISISPCVHTPEPVDVDLLLFGKLMNTTVSEWNNCYRTVNQFSEVYPLKHFNW